MTIIKSIIVPKVGRLLLPLSFLSLVNLAIAQDFTPTPQQLEQLQGLSQEETSRLLERRAGVGAGAQEPIVDISTVEPREVQADETDQRASLGQTVQQRMQIQQQPQRLQQDLEPFGYALFAGTPTTFAPATNIPVPSTYVIGPGDTVIIQLYGQQNITHQLVVTREGQLMFPEIGPINVSGLSFEELRVQLQSIVSNQLIGQSASISMGPLRSIDVFVLGEAARPGSYTVSSLSTMTNALFVSGGVTTVGSLRTIRLMRGGQQVTELDLYDLLLRGDTSGDARLQPGDVIFVPPVGQTIGIAGEVRRPAIYELKGETTVAEVLPLLGGLTPTAFPAASRIERINERGERTLIDVDLSQASSPLGLADGDFLQVARVMSQLESVVLLQGHVQRPGGFQWREGLRVSDLLPSVDRMLPDPDLQIALIAREVLPARRVELIHVDLGSAINAPGSEADLLLQARDQLHTFGLSRERGPQLNAFIQRLRDQASFENPPLVINVTGNVRFPGEYPLVRDMTLDMAIRFAGGLDADSDLDNVLLERRTDLQSTIAVERYALNPQSLSTASPVRLREQDRLIVFDANQPREDLLAQTLGLLRSQATSDSPTQVVYVTGAVRFPGAYPLSANLSVDDLLTLAGGFLESANTTSAELARFDAEPVVGRELSVMDIDLGAAGVSGRGRSLNPFDRLTVRQMPNWRGEEVVTIGGEVNTPGVYVISESDTVATLVARAGGLTKLADPNAAIFLRESLRQREQEVLERARLQLERDLISLQLGAGEAGEDGANLEQIQSLIQRTTEAEASGRLVIDLPRLLASKAFDQVKLSLQDGDRLLIPRQREEVSVVGEVFQPSAHLFNEDLTPSDYIARSGGFNANADSGKIYVITSSGEVKPLGGMRWFFQSRARIEPGDTIVVPTDIYQPGQLQTWTSLSQVLFNLSTTLLALNNVGI
jgi:polysaccharide export outer membrane protein